MSDIRLYATAREAGAYYAVAVANQMDKNDNGWHYFLTREEAAEFRESHPDPLNETTIDYFGPRN